MALLPQQRIDRLDGTAQDVLQEDRLTAQLDATAGDARNVEQVIHQSRQMGHLPFDARHRLGSLRVRSHGARQHLARIADGSEWIAQLVRQHRQKLVLLLVRGFQLTLLFLQGLARGDMSRNVAEVAHHSVTSVLQPDAADLPLVVFSYGAIQAVLGTLGGEIRLAGLQRMAEAAYQLVRVAAGPQDAHHALELTPQNVRNVPEHQPRGWIHLPDPEIGVDHIDTKRCLAEERLVLRVAIGNHGQRSIALQQGAHTRQQLARGERLHQIIVSAGVDALDARLFTGARR